jgi:hypothetical protein
LAALHGRIFAHAGRAVRKRMNGGALALERFHSKMTRQSPFGNPNLYSYTTLTNNYILIFHN